jgi:hypothetical protein
MDHWGDPWADDADTNTKSPTKSEEVKTPPPTQTNAPVLLNGFLDDAGWGAAGEEDDFGGWASSTDVEEQKGTVLETRVEDAEPTAIADELPDTNGYHGMAETGGFDLVDEGWGNTEDGEELSKEPDNVVSEASDSATTIQPDDNRERISTDFSDALHPEDDLSTRPSTSPSDISHNEAPTESPRTSFEDERNAGKAVEASAGSIHEDIEEVKGVVEDAEEAATGAKATATGGSDSDDFGDFEEDLEVEDASTEEPLRISGQDQGKEEISLQQETAPETSIHTRSVSITGLDIDSSLFTQLFSPTKASEKVTEAPEDPVHSTSTRKAWYRLTRKQTMREFNSGGDENNYVRVTWANSRIRTDVTKIVSRWANEDRVSGRGPGNRASFFWDQPAKTEHQTPVAHLRKKSIIPSAAPMRPANQNSQPLATNVPAAFDWSSPSTVTQDPWKQDNGGVRSVSSPLAAQPITVSKVKVQENRPVSMDFTPKPDVPTNHKKTASLISPIPQEIRSHTPPAPVNHTPGPSAVVDPWGDLGSLDTDATSKPTEGTVEDDDDWGEMVESPAVSTPNPAEFSSQNSSRDPTLSTPATTPKSVKSLARQPTPPKHASPIVRLKGTVSPTSAIFGPTSYVPASVEQGPIGPGLLKPARRNTPERSNAVHTSVSSMDEILSTNVEAPKPRIDDAEDFSAFESGDPQAATGLKLEDEFSMFESSTPKKTILAEPTTPTSPKVVSTPIHASADPWAEADFSFFESAAPPPAPAPNNPLSPSDPFSVFETPAPAPAPFQRTPPRPKTPPPQMPLTGATNAAQRRKAEEDEIIRNIVMGLPDLGYMLRR